MNHKHYIAFGLGVLVGYLVLPMALNLLKGQKAA